MGGRRAVLCAHAHSVAVRLRDVIVVRVNRGKAGDRCREPHSAATHLEFRQNSAAVLPITSQTRTATFRDPTSIAARRSSGRK